MDPIDYDSGPSTETPLKFTLDSIPAAKLLHYVRMDTLVRLIDEGTYNDLQNRARLAGLRFNSRFLKQFLAEDNAFIANLRDSAVGHEAYQKYVANVQRITNTDVREKGRRVRSAMAGPRRGFTGCVATRTKPEDFEYCAKNYDEPEYQNIKLVPSRGLRKEVHSKTGNPDLALPPKTSTSYLPRGLYSYMKEKPQYNTFVADRRQQQQQQQRKRARRGSDESIMSMFD